MMWTSKYNERLVGNEEARNRLKAWLSDFLDRKPGTKRAALLIGPAGTGKTTASYQALREADCQVVEQNAGAIRTRKSFEATIIQTVNSGALFGRTNALLLPNIDVINPSLGGLDVIMHVVNPVRGLKRAIRAQDRVDAAQVWTIPIIMTTNETPKGRLSDLESDCEVINFERIPHEQLATLARHVLFQECLEVTDAEVDNACRASEGDASSLLNILQSGLKASTDKADSVLESVCQLIFQDKPVTVDTLFRATKDDVLGTTSAYFENYLDAIEFSPDGAQLLSDADVIEGRLFQRQEWELLPFVGLIGCSSALSRPVVSKEKRLMPKRLSRRSVDPKTSALFHGSTRSKAAFISVKQKQLCALRSRLLLEGHSDASLERMTFLGTRLRSLLDRQDLNGLVAFQLHTGLSVQSAEEIVRTVTFGQLRARDKGLLRRSAA
jgi:DNA polymerase III delta prime subunit